MPRPKPKTGATQRDTGRPDRRLEPAGERYAFLLATDKIPGVEYCRWPRDIAAALNAYLRRSLGDDHEITLRRAKPPSGVYVGSITPTQFVQGRAGPGGSSRYGRGLNRPYQWGWEVSTPSQETAALLKLFFPDLIEPDQSDG